VAGHVGADASAVALSEEPGKSEDLVLIVDVGTNAEIMLGDRNRVLACSSPTGPAFEGAQISCGQRAAPGAIERVRIDPVTKEPRFKVIGCDLWSTDERFEEAVATTGVTGICGSGIIEAVAEMRMAGLVDASGLVGPSERTGTARSLRDGRTHSYLVYDGSMNGGPVITVTQADIRAIQLAKSALYAGARLLMDELRTERQDALVRPRDSGRGSRSGCLWPRDPVGGVAHLLAVVLQSGHAAGYALLRGSHPVRERLRQSTGGRDNHLACYLDGATGVLLRHEARHRQGLPHPDLPAGLSTGIHLESCG